MLTVRSGPSGPVEMGRRTRGGEAALSPLSALPTLGLPRPLFLPSGLWASRAPGFCFSHFAVLLPGISRSPEKQAAAGRRPAGVEQEHASSTPGTMADPPGLSGLSVQPGDAALEDLSSFLLPSNPFTVL